MTFLLNFFDTFAQQLSMYTHQAGIWWIGLVDEYQQHPFLGMHVVLLWWMLIQLYRQGPWTWMHRIRKEFNPTYQMPSPKYLRLMDISIVLMLILWWNIEIDPNPYLQLLRSSATAIEATRWIIGFAMQQPHDLSWVNARYQESSRALDNTIIDIKPLTTSSTKTNT